jgi:hypothetical protein
MKRTGSIGWWLAAGAGIADGVYGTYVGVAWSRFGRPSVPDPEDTDVLLDRFMPVHDIAERHRIHVAAPAAVTLTAARELDLFNLPIARAIFKGRELILGSSPDARQRRPHQLLAEMQAMGWTVLEEIPDREIVVGSATRPWEPNPTFRSIPASEFAAFHEPDYVKIVWTLRADPIDATTSTFRTDTRAIATDGAARAKFRKYWSFLSPGIILIRWASLRPVKRLAEQRFKDVLVGGRQRSDVGDSDVLVNRMDGRTHRPELHHLA